MKIQDLDRPYVNLRMRSHPDYWRAAADLFLAEIDHLHQRPTALLFGDGWRAWVKRSRLGGMSFTITTEGTMP